MKPMAHQAQSLKFLTKTPRAIDMSDPGTGKTFVEIEDFFKHYKDSNDKALVIAPKSLLESAWGDDIKKFRPDLKYSVAWAQNREAAFKASADMYITNLDAASWLAQQKPAFFKRFNRLIIDESTNFKHATSQRSKAMKKIIKHFEIRRAMSGTYYGNRLTDVWHQTFLVDDGKRLGSSFFAFRSAVCTPIQVGASASAVQWEEKPGMAEAIASLLEDITIRHKFEDCIDIPENHEYIVHTELAPKLRKIYGQMAKEAITVFKEKIISAANAAIVENKLRQIASGAVYAAEDTEGEGQYTLLDTTRYEAIADMVEAREHGIVFFHWRHQRDELVRQFDARKIKYCIYDGTVSDRQRQLYKDAFQNGFYQVMLAHPKSAGHGLTLTRGTYTLWASPTSNYELHQQGLQRVYRNTQKHKTENIIMCARDTVDEFAYARCLDRAMKATALHAYLEK